MSYNSNVPFLVQGDNFVTADDKVMRVLENVGEGIEIILYRNNAEPNRVDKTNYIERVGSLYGVFRTSENITEMDIEIYSDNVPQFNYIKIPAFNRYYFVTTVTMIRNGLWNVGVKIDILYSYMNSINNIVAFVDRNEYDFNEYIPDDKRTVYEGYDVDTKDITYDPDHIFYGDTEGFNIIVVGYKLGIRD